MSTVTDNLGLFKYNPATDGKEVFSIQTALNNNWDIIDARCGSNRNIGEIVSSTVPLVDAGLHLLDGSLIDGAGIYSAFVTHMATLYVNNPELFTTESDWQTSVTEFGACDKFVYSSTNNTVRLPKRTEEHGKLIDSYSSGTNWYRIYEDGWCEQGGTTGTISSTTKTSYLKTFPSTNYTFTMALLGSTKRDSAPAAVKDTDGFTIYHDAGLNNGLGWSYMACGYVDISDYKTEIKYEYITLANVPKTGILVDIDEIITDLNAKVDKSDLHEVQCVIETYTNGSSGYRIWSDGYCEQWGRYTINANTWTTVSLLKTYKDLYYNVLACEYNHQNANDWGAQQGAQPLTTSSIRLATGLDGRVITTWQTWGYIEV